MEKHKTGIRPRLHEDDFGQKRRHLSPFMPLVYTHMMKTRLKNGDLSGDLENGGRKKARVNTKYGYTLFIRAHLSLHTHREEY